VQRRRWQDLTPRQQATVLALASVQLSLAATAWADLATRPAQEVNGCKARWAAIIAINFLGPVAWFRWGRRPSSR
jgi:phospholipase D-like protein